MFNIESLRHRFQQLLPYPPRRQSVLSTKSILRHFHRLLPPSHGKQCDLFPDAGQHITLLLSFLPWRLLRRWGIPSSEIKNFQSFLANTFVRRLLLSFLPTSWQVATDHLPDMISFLLKLSWTVQHPKLSLYCLIISIPTYYAFWSLLERLYLSKKSEARYVSCY